MTALYNVKDEESEQRIITFTLCRKDVVLLGLGEEYSQCEDVIYRMSEGDEHDYDDSLSNSAGPIFIATGVVGILKEGFETKRWIRQVDVVPTMVTLLGTRFPHEYEGVLVY